MVTRGQELGMERQAEQSLPLVITASSVGTMIEWYDFYIFGSLAAILSPKFYPPGNDTFAYIAYLATFAVGFLVRPFGAIFFGRIGDLIGRKYAFLVTLSMMGLSTAVIGLLPTLQDGGMVCADRTDSEFECCKDWRWAASMAARQCMSASTLLTASAVSTRVSSKSRRRWDCSFPFW